MLQLQARVDLRAMAVMGNSAFPKASALLEPHHQIVSCYILETRWGNLILLQRSSRCILQPQPNGQTNSSIHYKPFVCMQLNGFKYCSLTLVILLIKYSYLTQTICTQLNGFNLLLQILILSKRTTSSIWSLDGILTYTITPIQSGLGSNSNEGAV